MVTSGAPVAAEQQVCCRDSTRSCTPLASLTRSLTHSTRQTGLAIYCSLHAHASKSVERFLESASPCFVYERWTLQKVSSAIIINK